jgi:hypothetical protein
VGGSTFFLTLAGDRSAQRGIGASPEYRIKGSRQDLFSILLHSSALFT